MSDGEDNSFIAGMKAFKDKQYHEAIVFFNAAIREKADIHKAFNALGVTYSKIGKANDAELCFEKALLLDPHNQTYEKNLKKISGKVNPVPSPASTTPPSPSFPDRPRNLLLMAISLILITVILVLVMLFVISNQAGLSQGGDGILTGGLIHPLIESFTREDYIAPVASVMVQSKKVSYQFDRHQDLSRLERVEAVVSIPDGTKTEFPPVANPQKNLYYGIDDPYFGKEKRFVVTGYFQDGSSAVLADSVLPPR